MSAVLRTEIAIVGAGVVGLALAAELSRTRDVVILERHEGIGRENSSHNSGVIHAGIYYPRDWLKTQLCIEGNRLLYAWAVRRRVRHHRVGKVIIAVTDAELPALEALRTAASENGVSGLQILVAGDLARLEPNVVADAGIWSPSTGVIDQMGLMQALLAESEEQGALVALKHTLITAERAGAGFALEVEGPGGAPVSLSCSAFINSSGLAADQVAGLLGYPLDGNGAVPRLRQRLNKGRYYDIVAPAKSSFLRHLVYPLPERDRSGLGVHVTMDIDGGLHLGPDTEWIDAAAETSFRSDDSRRQAFVEAAQRFLPWLEYSDVAPGQVGYRPKLHDPGEGPADFLIWHDRGYVHLGGIESPGMTAALAIARHVSALL
jgi:L-2-hydroxyglutarate oxidase LhgO